MFRGPSFIVSTMQEETTPIFKCLWYDWTQQQPGIEPTNPLGQCWVPPIVAFYDQQGLLRTYSLPGGSIRSPHPGSPRVAISYQHKMRGIPDPMEAFVVKKHFLGLASGEDNGDIRLPITRELLRKMVLAIPSMGFSQYKVVLLHALFLTLFHGFLRIGEATSSPSASTPIQHSDICITNNAVTIVLRSFKHSKKPHRIDISGEMEGSMCPVQALQGHSLNDVTILGLDTATDLNARLRLEEAWIHVMNTIQPRGLNQRF